MPLAYSYIRYSTTSQAKGDSYRRQTEATRQWCDENGYILAESTYHDSGVSAYKGQHKATGALARILEAVKSGSIPPGSALVVESLDRLSREDVLSALSLLLDIISHGIKVVTLADKQIYDPAEGTDTLAPKLMISISIMMRAHEESRIKGLRVAKAKEAKRRAVRDGKAKRLSTRCPWWLAWDAENEEFVISREEEIRCLVKLRLAGHGYDYIARQMTDRFGTTYHHSTIRSAIRNPALYGAIRTKDGIIPDYYPSVITESDWWRMQSDAPAGRKHQRRAVFAGLLQCTKCGGNVKRNKAVTHKIPYAYCRTCGKMTPYRTDEWLRLIRVAWSNLGDNSTEAELIKLTNRKEKISKIINNLQSQIPDLAAKGLDVSPVLTEINKQTDELKEINKKIKQLQTIDDSPIPDTDIIEINRYLRQRIAKIGIDVFKGEIKWIKYKSGQVYMLIEPGVKNIDWAKINRKLKKAVE